MCRRVVRQSDDIDPLRNDLAFVDHHCTKRAAIAGRDVAGSEGDGLSKEVEVGLKPGWRDLLRIDCRQVQFIAFEGSSDRLDYRYPLRRDRGESRSRSGSDH